MYLAAHRGSLRGIFADRHSNVWINQNASGFQFRLDLQRCLIRGEASDLNATEYDEVDFARLAHARRAGELGGIKDLNVDLIARADCDLWRSIHFRSGRTLGLYRVARHGISSSLAPSGDGHTKT